VQGDKKVGRLAMSQKWSAQTKKKRSGLEGERKNIGQKKEQKAVM